MWGGNGTEGGAGRGEVWWVLAWWVGGGGSRLGLQHCYHILTDSSSDWSAKGNVPTQEQTANILLEILPYSLYFLFYSQKGCFQENFNPILSSPFVHKKMNQLFEIAQCSIASSKAIWAI